MTEQLSVVVQKLVYWVYLTWHFLGFVIRNLSACTRESYREICSMGWLPLCNGEQFETEGAVKTKFLPELWLELWTPGPRPSTLATSLSLHPILQLNFCWTKSQPLNGRVMWTGSVNHHGHQRVACKSMHRLTILHVWILNKLNNIIFIQFSEINRAFCKNLGLEWYSCEASQLTFAMK